MIETLFYFLIFIATYLGVKMFHRWSLRRKLFDVPNERSSHKTPTPRGGGLIIVLISLFAYTVYTAYFTHNFQWSYLIGAVAIALVSWLDDLRSISFVWRFTVHSGAAVTVIVFTGYFQEIYVPFYSNVNAGLTGAVITFLWIVWLTNAYNFMDGIDGIAGTQAVIAGIGWLIIGKFLGLPTAAFYGGAIAFSSLGFLIQNWQPAKIFMGDVGSAFLGYSLAVLPLLSKGESGNYLENSALLPLIAVLLVWLFVFDTIFTFIRRILNGEKVWQAHRGHLYQRIIIARHSHQFVTILYGLLTVLTAGFLIVAVSARENREVYFLYLFLELGLQTAALIVYTYLIQKKENPRNEFINSKLKL